MQETIYSRDGCVFRPAGVVCEKGAGVACYGCGWHPRIEAARKEQAREKLRRGEFKPPATPIGEKYDAARHRLWREGGGEDV